MRKSTRTASRLAATATAVIGAVVAVALLAPPASAQGRYLITGADIARDTITSENLAPGSVGSSELAASAVRTEDIAFAAVGANQLKWNLVEVVFAYVWLLPGQCYMKAWDVPDSPMLLFQPYFHHAENNSSAQQHLPVTAFPTRRPGMAQVAVRICNTGSTAWSSPPGGAVVVVPYLKW